MKRKIALLCVLICSLLSACGIEETLAEKTEQARTESEQKRFIKSYYDDNTDSFIIVDRETNIQYLVVYKLNGLGVCVLVDAEGKPLLYEVGGMND